MDKSVNKKNDTFLTFRCQNRKAHVYHGNPKEGNIVAFLGKSSIVIRCPDSKCRGWTSLEFKFPGIDIDLRKAGIVQSSIAAETMKLNSLKAAVIVDSES